MGLEERLSTSKRKTISDTVSVFVSNTVPGVVLDLFTGLNFSGIVTTRITSGGINLASSAYYGRKRDELYEKIGDCVTEPKPLGNKVRNYVSYLVRGLGMLTGSTMDGSLETDYLFDYSKFRRTTVEMITFNVIQVPLYAVAVAAGSFFSEGYVDLEKVAEGSAYLAAVSPVAAPILGWSMDRGRRLVKVQEAREK